MFWSPAPGSHPGPCTDLSEADLGQAPSPPHPLPRRPASPRGSLPAEPERLPKSYRVRESLVMTPPAETCLPLCAGKPLWKTVNGRASPITACHVTPAATCPITARHVPHRRLPRAPSPPATCPVATLAASYPPRFYFDWYRCFAGTILESPTPQSASLPRRDFRAVTPDNQDQLGSRARPSSPMSVPSLW